MNSIIEKLAGLDKMTDQVIATDYLVSLKSGIQNYAVAITETMSIQLRAALISQLNSMITSLEILSDYMMKKGLYHAYDLQTQYEVTMQATDAALGLKEFLT